MFDHVTIRASDRPASQRFYEVVLDPDGNNVELVFHDRHGLV